MQAPDMWMIWFTVFDVFIVAVIFIAQNSGANMLN